MSLKATLKDITASSSRNETTYEVEITAAGASPSFEEVREAALAQAGLAARQMYPRAPQWSVKHIEWVAGGQWLVTILAKPS